MGGSEKAVSEINRPMGALAPRQMSSPTSCRTNKGTFGMHQEWQEVEAESCRRSSR